MDSAAYAMKTNYILKKSAVWESSNQPNSHHRPHGMRLSFTLPQSSTSYEPPAINMKQTQEHFNLSNQYYYQSKVQTDIHTSPQMSTQYESRLQYESKSQFDSRPQYENRPQYESKPQESKSFSDREVQKINDRLNEIASKLEQTAAKVSKHQQALNTKYNLSDENSEVMVRMQEIMKNWSTEKEREAMMQNALNKSHIEALKQEFYECPKKLEIEEQLLTMEANINSAISKISSNLIAQIDVIADNNAKVRKNQIEKIKAEIEERLSTFKIALERVKKEEDVSTEASSMESIHSQYTGVRKIFLGDPILIKFSNKVTVRGTQIECHEVCYKIDSEGYLLDNDNLYIMNSKNQQIQLTQQQISMLEAQGILK